MKKVAYFHPALRVLHWLMAAAILIMLFIGVAMVSTVSSLHSLLVSIHKPLGVMILLLVIVRLWLRFTTATPSLLSAAGYPVTLGNGIVLPPIMHVNNDWYALLRPLHTWVALALFATVLLHLAAALLHAFVLRDGVFSSMTGIRKP